MRGALSPRSFVLAGLLGIGCAFLSVPVALEAAASGGIGNAAVVGAHLVRDGNRWIPHGFSQIAFAVAPGEFNYSKRKFFQTAYDNYSATEYVKMKAVNADSVRMQVA